MEITGYSTDFVVDSSFSTCTRSFIARQLERWPNLLLCGEPMDAARLPEWVATVTPGEKYSEILTFSSGPAMEDFWEENGYALNSSGEGPFSIFYAYRHQLLTAQEVRQVRSTRPEDEQSLEGAQLLMSDFFIVSLVTPADPQADPFSGGILREFVDSFADSQP